MELLQRLNSSWYHSLEKRKSGNIPLYLFIERTFSHPNYIRMEIGSNVTGCSTLVEYPVSMTVYCYVSYLIDWASDRHVVNWLLGQLIMRHFKTSWRSSKMLAML